MMFEQDTQNTKEKKITERIHCHVCTPKRSIMPSVSLLGGFWCSKWLRDQLRMREEASSDDKRMGERGTLFFASDPTCSTLALRPEARVTAEAGRGFYYLFIF